MAFCCKEMLREMERQIRQPTIDAFFKKKPTIEPSSRKNQLLMPSSRKTNY
jgi:hypothetical protein